MDVVVVVLVVDDGNRRRQFSLFGSSVAAGTTRSRALFLRRPRDNSFPIALKSVRFFSNYK